MDNRTIFFNCKLPQSDDAKIIIETTFSWPIDGKLSLKGAISDITKESRILCQDKKEICQFLSDTENSGYISLQSSDSFHKDISSIILIWEPIYKIIIKNIQNNDNEDGCLVIISRPDNQLCSYTGQMTNVFRNIPKTLDSVESYLSKIFHHKFLDIIITTGFLINFPMFTINSFLTVVKFISNNFDGSISLNGGLLTYMGIIGMNSQCLIICDYLSDKKNRRYPYLYNCLYINALAMANLLMFRYLFISKASGV